MRNIRSTSGFIHPFHFNRGHLVGEMTEPGIVVVDDEKYSINPRTFFTTEKVHLFLHRDMYETESQYQARQAEEQAARDAHLQQQAQARELSEQRAKEARLRMIEEFKNFQATYNFPFKSSVRIKIVLSGLTENSNGDGARRNSVFHLFVEEELTGSLKRAANTFLCSPKDAGKWASLGDTEHQRPVTCKKCLKLMERWHV